MDCKLGKENPKREYQGISLLYSYNSCSSFNCFRVKSMEDDIIQAIIIIIQALILIFLSPLVIGIIRKIEARSPEPERG